MPHEISPAAWRSIIGAILAFLVLMGALAIWMRKKDTYDLDPTELTTFDHHTE